MNGPLNIRKKWTYVKTKHLTAHEMKRVGIIQWWKWCQSIVQETYVFSWVSWQYILRYLGINNFSLKRILFRFELVWTLDRVQRRKNTVWKLYRWGIYEIPVYFPVYPQNTAVFQYIFQYIFLSSIFQYIPVWVATLACIIV